MATVTISKTWAETAPFDDLLPSDLNQNFDDLVTGINTIDSAQLAAGAVVEAKIGSGAVTAAKIGSGAVTAAKLAEDAVEYKKVKDGDIGSDKMDIYESAVTTLSGSGTTDSFTHGLVDEDGTARAPKIVIVYEDNGTDFEIAGGQIHFTWNTTTIDVEDTTGTADVKVVAF